MRELELQPGRARRASLDTTSGYLVFPGTSVPLVSQYESNATGLTMELWFADYPAGTTHYQEVISHVNAGQTAGWDIEWQGGSPTINVIMLPYDYVNANAGFGGIYTSGLWVYAASVYSGGTAWTLYSAYDGGQAPRSISTLSMSHLSSPGTGTDLWLGSVLPYNSNYFGRIALFRLWNRALSLAELQTIWNTHLPPGGGGKAGLFFHYDAAQDFRRDLVSGTVGAWNGTPVRTAVGPTQLWTPARPVQLWTPTTVAPLSTQIGGGGGGTNWSQSLTDYHSALDTRGSQIGKQWKDAFSQTDNWTKQSVKSLLDVLSAQDILTKSTAKLLQDSMSQQDVLTKVPVKFLSDYISATDIRSSEVTKTLGDATSAFDGLVRLTGKYLLDTTSVQDVTTKALTKRLSDFLSFTDTFSTLQAHFLSKLLIDSFSQTDTVSGSKIGAQAWKQTILDVLSATDGVSKNVTKPLTDRTSALDVLVKLPGKWLTDNLSALDTLGRIWTAHLAILDGFSQTDQLEKMTTKSLSENFSSQDFLQRLSGKLLVLTDNFSQTDAFSKVALKALAETITSQDAMVRRYTKVILDSLSATDRLTAGRALLLTLQDWMSATDSYQTLHSFPTGVYHLGIVLGTITNLLGIQVALTTPLLTVTTDIVAITILTSLF